MTSSIRQDESDDWTAQFFREIEDWFRDQYGCDGEAPVHERKPAAAWISLWPRESNASPSAMMPRN